MSAGRDVITATGNYAPTIINLPAETSSVDLDTALAILDAMPTVDSVPRAVYRVGSSLQRGANPHFVGREAELRQLAQLLKAEGGGAAIGQAAVTGLGGIGKTQLAAEFVHRYGRFFAGGVFWLNLANLSLDDIQEAERQLSEWGEAVGRPDFLALDAPTRLQLVKHALHAPIPRLLVFDNLDHRNAPRMLQQLRPKTGGCRVLITSRRGTWASSTGVQQLTLATLPQAESRQLLLKLAPHLTAAEADRVAERLGYFPLALYLAGSFLNTYKHPTNQFLARYERQKLNHRAMQGQWLEDYSVTEHDLSVYGTFSVSWEQLDTAHPIDQLAIWVMQHAACFAPSESISTTLLTATLEQREGWPPIDADAANVADRIINVLRRLVQLGWPPIDAGAADVADRIVDALRRLMQLGLLDTEQGLHRLMGEFVGVDVIAQAAVEKGASSEAFRLNTAGYPAALRAWRGHLFYITEAALQRADEHSATLATNLGYHIQADGDYAGARPYYERSLSIREKSLGADHPDTALSLNNLGMLIQSMGDYAGARPYFERSLA
ncbi:MAG: tetratricopeptide repeat protein, partial [Candidatus Promineifilaceae bacterium]